MDDPREHLAKVEQHIEEFQAHIARQKETIAQLKLGGHETEFAVSMLKALERSLQAFEQHRELILDWLNKSP